MNDDLKVVIAAVVTILATLGSVVWLTTQRDRFMMESGYTWVDRTGGRWEKR